MKKINLKRSTIVGFTINSDQPSQTVEELDDGKFRSHLGSIKGSDFKALNQSRENCAEVIWATIEIEKKLETAITAYFKGNNHYTETEKWTFFERELIQNPAMTFNFKKELVKKIAIRCKKPKGKELDDLQSYLKK